MSGNYINYREPYLLTLAKGEDACKVYKVAMKSSPDNIIELVPLDDYNTIVELYNSCIKGIIDDKSLEYAFETNVFYTPSRFFD